MKRPIRSFVGLCLGLLLGGAGCADRLHLSPSYGQATRHALAQQVIDPAAGQHAKPSTGLDPEEASIVLDTYRKSLSPTKDTQAATRAPVLVLPAPPPGSQAGQGMPLGPGYGP